MLRLAPVTMATRPAQILVGTHCVDPHMRRSARSTGPSHKRRASASVGSTRSSGQPPDAQIGRRTSPPARRATAARAPRRADAAGAPRRRGRRAGARGCGRCTRSDRDWRDRSRSAPWPPARCTARIADRRVGEGIEADARLSRSPRRYSRASRTWRHSRSAGAASPPAAPTAGARCPRPPRRPSPRSSSGIDAARMQAARAIDVGLDHRPARIGLEGQRLRSASARRSHRAARA